MRDVGPQIDLHVCLEMEKSGNALGGSGFPKLLWHSKVNLSCCNVKAKPYPFIFC